jgi:hypothetical protein
MLAPESSELRVLSRGEKLTGRSLPRVRRAHTFTPEGARWPISHGRLPYRAYRTQVEELLQPHPSVPLRAP